MEIHFSPYKGDYYEKGILGKKVLVLGHTYPCNEYLTKEGCKEIPNADNLYCRGCGFTQRFCSGVTEETVKEYIGNKWEGREGGRRKATHTKFLKSLLPDVYHLDAYRYVAFYNFVQVAVNANSGLIGQAEEKYYELSVEPFLKVLDQYQPDCIIIWGKHVFYKLLFYIEKLAHIVIEFKTDNHFTIHYNGNYYHVMRIMHPSSGGYKRSVWTDKIKEFLLSF